MALLILLNVVLGTRQELKARASIDALSNLQVPQAKVLRDGSVALVPAVDIVPGDIVQLEAGDIVPADGRIVRSATLETQEAALTGESAPIAKDAARLPDDRCRARRPLEHAVPEHRRDARNRRDGGDGDGHGDPDGPDRDDADVRHAHPIAAAAGARLADKVLGLIAWGAVAFIVVVGVARGQPFSDVLLLGTAMAISAIPTGMPAFVSGLLSMGAKQLAEAKAVVKNLTDVETLGATSAINTDKTGTLTMNQMMVSVVYANGTWFTVEGEGYRKSGAIRRSPGRRSRTSRGSRSGSCSTATRPSPTTARSSATRRRLRSSCSRRSSASTPRRRGARTRGSRRCRSTPTTSSWRRSTACRSRAASASIMLVKGGPDVVLARCAMSGGPLSGSQVPIAEARAEIDAANARMGEQGLRVLAFAARFVDDDELETMADRPDVAHPATSGSSGWSASSTPCGAEAKSAVRDRARRRHRRADDHGRPRRHGPGDRRDARPRARGDQRRELQALSDEELVAGCRELHVFGRVSPEDKLRLARMMQEQGLIVAMTGDAVNDAAALKQADIGVAMGSGSEVTKQAGRMILTDDNFGTLVHAVEIGRRVYDKVVVVRALPDDAAARAGVPVPRCDGVRHQRGRRADAADGALPALLLTAAGVVVIAVDPGDPDVMHRPPRDPKLPITNRARGHRCGSSTPRCCSSRRSSRSSSGRTSRTPTAVRVDDDDVRRDGPRHGVNALTNRRDPTSGLSAAAAQGARDLLVPVALIVLATELPGLQRAFSRRRSRARVARVLWPGAAPAARRRDGKMAPTAPCSSRDRARCGASPGSRPCASDARRGRGHDAPGKLVMPASTPAVVPRWEWRTFADDLALDDPSNELTPSEVRESDEVYALSPAPASVKFRDDVVDVKVLEQVDDAGLEQWRPVLKAAFPLSAGDVGVLLDGLDVTSRPGSIVRRTAWRSSAACSGARGRPRRRRAQDATALPGRRLSRGADHGSCGGCAGRHDRGRVGGPGERGRASCSASASRCGRT